MACIRGILQTPEMLATIDELEWFEEDHQRRIWIHRICAPLAELSAAIYSGGDVQSVVKRTDWSIGLIDDMGFVRWYDLQQPLIAAIAMLVHAKDMGIAEQVVMLVAKQTNLPEELRHEPV